MVDVSSQSKNINVTASSIGTAGNINVTPDMARYWSEKSKQWAISDRLIDDEDYSSKYYANQSKQNAQKIEDTVQEVIDTANSALSDIGSIKDSAIYDITSQENISVENVNTAGAAQVALAKEQADIATEQAQSVSNKVQEVEEATENAITSITNQETISKNSLIDEGSTQIGLIQQEAQTQISNIEQTGFYMRDGHLYYIDEDGEEQEFKSGNFAAVAPSIISGTVKNGDNESLHFLVESIVLTSDWTRPNLIENGTVGGNTYAAYCSDSVNSDKTAFKAFNEDTQYQSGTNNFWGSQNNNNEHWCGFYSPIPFKCTSVTIRNGAEDINKYASTAGRIEASNDNVNWTVEATYTNNNTTNGAYWTVNLTNPIYAKYRRVVSTKSAYGNYVYIANINFDNATQRIEIQGGKTFILDDCTVVQSDGEVKQITTTTTDVDNIPAGNYSVFIDTNTNTLLFEENYFNQRIAPTSPSEGLIWYDTSQYPIVCKRFIENEWVVSNNLVKLATTEIRFNNGITYIQNVVNDTFNKNGVGINAKSAGFPSDNYINLTLGTTGTIYIAPADGWFQISKKVTAAGQWLGLWNPTAGNLVTSNTAQHGTQTLEMFIPVSKNDEVEVNYNAAGVLNYFRFIYANGAKAEE